jgi:hypothetical protein
MTLKERINNDLKTAMKGGDKIRLEAIRSVRAQIIEFEKRGTGKEITPDDELSILNSQVKSRKESIEQFSAGKRNDLVEIEEKFLKVILEYLPRQLTPEEAEQVVRSIIQQTGASTQKDFGKVMSLAMKELKGNIDGKIVQELVKKNLEG